MKKRESLTISELIHICEEEIEDPRRPGGNLRHKLVDILVIALLGVICGCEEWIEIEDYGIAKEEWLRQYLELPNGVPSNDTYRRVFERIEPAQLEAAYRKWVLPYVGGCYNKQIAIDGKTICGASNRRDEGKLHIVSAWVKEDKITLGQLKTSEKSNEITAIPELLDMLDVRGAAITVDAMGCQTAIAEKIISKEAQYVLAVKQNQGNLYTAMEEYFQWAQDEPSERAQWSRYVYQEHEHGRHCKRIVEVTNDAGWYTAKKEWKQLTSMIRVTRKSERKGVPSEEHAYYISSADWDANRFAQLIQGHWSIENSLHWSLDVTYCEDDCQIHTGHAPENLSLVRKIAKSLLQTENSFKGSANRKSKRASYINDYAAKVIGFDRILK